MTMTDCTVTEALSQQRTVNRLLFELPRGGGELMTRLRSWVKGNFGYLGPVRKSLLALITRQTVASCRQSKLSHTHAPTVVSNYCGCRV